MQASFYSCVCVCLRVCTAYLDTAIEKRLSMCAWKVHLLIAFEAILILLLLRYAWH